MLRCALLLAASYGPVAMGARAADAQSPRKAVSPLQRQTVSNLALEHVAIILRARSDGRVELGAATGDSALALTFDGRALTEWVDSARALLRPPTSATSRRRPARSTVQEPETRGGGMSLDRRPRGRGVTYSLFFANRTFGGFAAPVSVREARIFLQRVSAALAAARRLRRRVHDVHVHD